MKEILSDKNKFKDIDIKAGKEINFMLQQEDRLIDFLKRIKGSISDELYKYLYPRGSKPGVMYLP